MIVSIPRKVYEENREDIKYWHSCIGQPLDVECNLPGVYEFNFLLRVDAIRFKLTWA